MGIAAALDLGDDTGDEAAHQALARAKAKALTDWDALVRDVTALRKRAGKLDVSGGRPEEVAEWITDLEEEITEVQWRKYEIIATAAVGGFTAHDVADWVQRAEGMGVTPRLPRTLIEDLVSVARVPNAGLREAFVRWEADPARPDDIETVRLRIYGALVAIQTETGRDCGAENFGQTRGYGPHIRRCLGLEVHDGSVRLFVPHDTAVAMCAGLQLPTYQFGF